jgi:Ca2+-binding EF-hand superfamily protein
LLSIAGEKLTLKELTTVMKSMDDNNNGTISFDEFVKGVYEYVVKSKSLSEKT